MSLVMGRVANAGVLADATVVRENLYGVLAVTWVLAQVVVLPKNCRKKTKTIGVRVFATNVDVVGRRRYG